MTRREAATAAPGATAWIVAGSTVNGIAAFLFQIVGTRALGPVAYAPISVLWTLQYLWIAVAVTALEAYVTRMVTVGGPAAPELRRFLRLFTWALLAAAAITAGVGFGLREQLFAGLADLGVVLGLVVLGYGWYAMVRGRAAGLDRFRAYGLATAGESVLRLVAAVLVLLVVTGPRALAWVFPVGPLLIAAWAWGRRHITAYTPRRRSSSHEDQVPTGGSGHESGGSWHEAGGSGHEAGGSGHETDVGPAPEPRRRGRRFLAATSTANASVQLLLAGGPLALVPLGASASTISVYFTTITAARVPMTFALNGGLSRLLPPLTRMSQADDRAGLARAAWQMMAGIAGLATLGGLVGATVGPELIALLFGEGFRPGRSFVTVISVSTVLAVGGLLLDQLYIAMGRERRLPAVWLGAVALAGVLVLVLPGSPTMRVAVAVAVGTAAAVAALSVPLLRRA